MRSEGSRAGRGEEPHCFRRGTAEVIFRGFGIHRGGFGRGNTDNREERVDPERVDRLRALSDRAAEFHRDAFGIQPLQERAAPAGAFPRAV